MATDSTSSATGVTRWRQRLAGALGVEAGAREEMYRQVARTATLKDVTYWLEILMSAGIAILGLSLDSPAVIIGAMLISPLMGPILAAGLALAAGDFVLLARTALNVAISSLAAVSFAALFVVFLPFREITGEIAARLRPTTLDLFVALLSGAVGALAAGKAARGITTSIPGVAIAVALMPPLSVVGYGVGIALRVDPRQGAEVARGGGLLFVTNLVAIVFSAMLVFVLLHFDAADMRDKIREWRESDPEGRFVHELIIKYPIPDWLDRVGTGPVRLAIPLIFVLVLFVPLSRSLDRILTELAGRKQSTTIQQQATSLWQDNFSRLDGDRRRSSILSLTSFAGPDRVDVRLRVVTNEPLRDNERSLYVRLLGAALGRDPKSIVLDLVEIPMSEAWLTARKEAPREKVPTAGELMAALQSTLDPLLARVYFPSRARVLDHAVTLKSGAPLITFRYLAAEELEADARELLVARARQVLEMPGATIEFTHVPSVLGISFRDGSTSMDARSEAALEALADAVVDLPGARLNIRGPANSRLGQRRLDSVQNALSDSGRFPVERVSLEPLDGTQISGVEIAVALP